MDREFYAIITDLVGTPTDLIDITSTAVAGRASTSLWGLTSWSSGASTPIRFPGQYHDEETGLHYNLHRYYNPATARYITNDPLGLSPSPNPNTYPHNPIQWSDPLGLIPDPCDGNSSPASNQPFTTPDDHTRVGRWMGLEEYEKMLDTGKVQPGSGDRTYVANPADPSSFMRQAKPGSVYVEFDVPTSTLKPGGEPGWAQIPGPNTMFGTIAARQGHALEFPNALNIRIEGEK